MTLGQGQRRIIILILAFSIRQKKKSKNITQANTRFVAVGRICQLA